MQYRNSTILNENHLELILYLIGPKILTLEMNIFGLQMMVGERGLEILSALF